MTTTAWPTTAASKTDVIAWDVFKTAWGWVGAASSPHGLCWLAMPLRTKSAAQAAAATAGGARDSTALADVRGQVQGYFEGKLRRFRLRVDLKGLPTFTADALNRARGIAYGRTVTYGALARQLGKPGASRAVGQAMARNPVPIVVPCHRVVGASGLCGFSAEEGIDLKRRLLAFEGWQVPGGW